MYTSEHARNTCTSMHTRAHMQVQVGAGARSYAYICARMRTSTRICKHTYEYGNTQAHTSTKTPVQQHTRACTRAHTCDA